MCFIDYAVPERLFFNVSFGERIQSGVVDRIISRMITLLCEQARSFWLLVYINFFIL